MSGFRKKNKSLKTKSHEMKSEKNLFWAGILVILVITFIAYLPATKAGYIWDDDDHFTENELLNDWEGFKGIWSSSSAIYYPLVLTSFWIMRRLWGLCPLPYHLVNIFLHVVNAALFWIVLKRLKIRGAWIAAAIFALHPVHVESVAWITELKNTQSGVFYLLSFLYFHKYCVLRKNVIEKNDKKARGAFLLSLFLFILALLSKPSTVMLPAVMVVFLWWEEGKTRLRHVVITAPFFILSLLSSLWTIWEQRYHSRAEGPEWSLTLLERLLAAGRIVWFYLWKLIIPYPLIFIYPRWEVDASRVLWYAPLFFLMVAFAVFWWKRAGWGRGAIFAFGYFVILLFPVMGFFNIYFMRFSYVGDHFQYLASMGPIALFAAGLSWLSSRFRERRILIERISVSTLLLVYAILTWNQTKIYKDEITLWEATLKKNPNAWIAWHNLGYLMMIQNRNQEAMDYYAGALRLKPDYWEAYFNMGLIVAEDGFPEWAIECFRKALELNPLEIKIHNDLGVALSRIGRFEEALKEIDYYLGLEPNDASAYYNKATVLSAMGKFRESLSWYEKAIELDSEFYQAHCDMGIAYYRLGETEKAISRFQEALRVNPDDEVARANLRLIREKNEEQKTKDER